jgi:carbonic anhydrase/acetyltransferase-like protein (isoleucine patch superfamily)
MVRVFFNWCIYMVLYRFEDRIPKIGKNTFIAKSAEVIGDVNIGNNCYIGPGAKIRGDYGTIHIGNRTSIQENCVIHAQVDKVCIIGDNVTIGHGAIIHGPRIHNNIIIGMGAIIGDHAEIHDWCLVAAGALVKDSQILEEESLAVGIPAKVLRKVSDRNKELIKYSANVYADLSERYLKGFEKIGE